MSNEVSFHIFCSSELYQHRGPESIAFGERPDSQHLSLSLPLKHTPAHTHSHTHFYTCSHSSPDIWWDSTGSCYRGTGTLTRTKDTSAVMTCPYWPDRAEKQEVGTRLRIGGHPSWEGDLNTVEKSHRDTERYNVLCLRPR